MFIVFGVQGVSPWRTIHAVNVSVRLGRLNDWWRTVFIFLRTKKYYSNFNADFYLNDLFGCAILNPLNKTGVISE